MMASAKKSIQKNIFILGPDAYNIQQFELIKNIPEYEFVHFHSLLTQEEMLGHETIDLVHLIEKCEYTLRRFPGKVDAIISPWDFPACFLACYLRNKLNLPGQGLESFFRCEHKYWSRLLQQKVIPQHIPHFEVFDPFKEEIPHLELNYPFWLKPIKSFESHLGFLIRNRQDFLLALSKIRRDVRKLGDAFSLAMGTAQLPENVACVKGHFCLAEELISRKSQITVEGYCFKGDVNVIGVVDSQSIEGSSSFHSYQYPSQIPEKMKNKVFKVTEDVMREVDMRSGPFNIEYFYDDQADELFLLEINTRSSQSHSDLFYKVDGAPLFKASVDLFLNKPPSFPYREGAFHCAAKFFIRHFGDGFLSRVPTDKEIVMVKRFFPEVSLSIPIKEGESLARQKFQDSYSYTMATLHVGGDDRFELALKYEQIKEILSFQIDEEPEYVRQHLL